MSSQVLFYILEGLCILLGVTFLYSGKKSHVWYWISLVAGYAAWCGILQGTMVYTLIAYAHNKQAFFPGPVNVLISILWDLIPIKLWWLAYPLSVIKGFNWLDIVGQSLVCSAGFIIVWASFSGLVTHARKIDKTNVANQITIGGSLKKTQINYLSWLFYMLGLALCTGVVQSINLFLPISPGSNAFKQLFPTMAISLLVIAISAIFSVAMTRYALDAESREERYKAAEAGKRFQAKQWETAFLLSILWLVAATLPILLSILASGGGNTTSSYFILIPSLLYYILLLILGTKLSMTLHYAVDDGIPLGKAIVKSWVASGKVFWRLFGILAAYVVSFYLVIFPSVITFLLLTAKRIQLKTGTFWLFGINAVLFILILPILEGTKLTFIAEIKHKLESNQTKANTRKQR